MAAAFGDGEREHEGTMDSLSGLGGHRHGSPPVNADAARLLWTLIALCALVTVFAAIVLWPRGESGFEDPLLLDSDPVPATVTRAELEPCSTSLLDQCVQVEFEITGGTYAGVRGTIEQGLDGSLSVGDDILLDAFETEAGRVIYSFYDYQRGSSMMWLVVMFAAAIVALGRWRGLGALAGLAFSMLVIVVFTLPAILDGSDAFAVALVTASLIAFAALFLAHGFTIATAVSLLSTFASLVVTAVLGALFVGATHLTGLADESSLLLGGLAEGIDARGILLAGVVIGSLGVLDDVTVTQVAAVWELKHVQPGLSTAGLVGPALRIGRDHISSTVNTLFLAYAGAALPLLLLFTKAGQGFTDVITRELVATEVVRALVGSIGLVASVPISTWLAAAVLAPASAEPDRDGA